MSTKWRLLSRICYFDRKRLRFVKVSPRACDPQGPPTIDEKDTARRQTVLNDFITGRRWVDIGAGFGDLIEKEMTASRASSFLAVEPNIIQRNFMMRRGIPCVSEVNEIDTTSPAPHDLATMFHVLEHVHDPRQFLQATRRILRPDGLLIVEVPHARDVLLQTYASVAFQEFTFWSEHLILHTETSLVAVLEDTGFEVQEVRRVQRYPITNHLFWLARGLPGGHNEYAHLRSSSIDAAYEHLLQQADQTDTLLVIASRT